MSETRGEYRHLTGPRHIRANWDNRARYDDEPAVQRIGDELSSRHIEPDSYLPQMGLLLDQFRAVLRKTQQKGLSRVGRLHVAHVVVQALWREVED